MIARRFAEIKARARPGRAGLHFFLKMHQRRKLSDAETGARGDRHQQHGQLLALLPGAGDHGAFRTVGYGGDSGSIRDIEQAGLVVIIGSNTAESHPVLATRVKRAHKLRGQKLIVSDLREHEMARRADISSRPNPGTDLVWLSAVSRIHPRQRPGEDGIRRSVGERFRRISREPGAVHVGISPSA